MLNLFRPTWYYHSIYQIELDELKKEGISGLIVDLDNTLIERNSGKTSKTLRRWLLEIKRAGFKCCIVSNNWSSRVSRIARELNVPMVAPAGKPRRKAFQLGLDSMGTCIKETAVIGDQLFTDILGGNLMSLKTILVVPLSNRDLPHTKMLRVLERLILARLEKKNLLRKKFDAQLKQNLTAPGAR